MSTKKLEQKLHKHLYRFEKMINRPLLLLIDNDNNEKN